MRRRVERFEVLQQHSGVVLGYTSSTMIDTTTILEQPKSLIFIYESGVLVIDERLQVVLHREKLINDFFVAIEGNALRFLRDHDEEWLMPMD